jgi:hypothetical protein
MVEGPERGASSQRADATRAVVAGMPPQQETTARIRRLAEEFNATRARLQEETGFDQRRLPFATRASEMTVAQFGSIAALFGTSVTEEYSMGARKHSITIPGSEEKITFFSARQEGADSTVIKPYTDLLYIQPEGGGDKRHTQFTADDLVVVMGDSSVSFVKRGLRSTPQAYGVATFTPDGSHIRTDYDQLLLEDPVHMINLAKAITVLKPEPDNL